VTPGRRGSPRVDFEECMALQCGSCKKFFCGFCHKSAQTSTGCYDHVQECDMNLTRNGSYHADPDIIIKETVTQWDRDLRVPHRERLYCLLVLDSVTSAPQCIRQPRPRVYLKEGTKMSPRPPPAGARFESANLRSYIQ